MKFGKTVRRTAAWALALSVIPYQINKDEKTGILEVRSLLWGLKKIPPKEGEENGRTVFAIPASGLDKEEAEPPKKAAEENVRTWWQPVSDSRAEWLKMDLGKVYDVHAVQINFADDAIDIPCPGEVRGGSQARFIEDRDLKTQWKLEGSDDGRSWFVIEDKTDAETDLSHDLIIREEGMRIRHLRLSGMAVPYGQKPCVSGLRVFGLGQGEKPAAPAFEARRSGDLDMLVRIAPQENTVGYNILFGSGPEKLYHSYMVFSDGEKRVGALIAGRDYWVRVDAFNENGITEGACVRLA